MAQSASVDVELKVPAEKVMEVLKGSVQLFPKIMPDMYKSIQVLEGDGSSPGTLNLVNYKPEVTHMTYAKEKILAVDDINMSFTYEVVEGELLQLYKVFKPTVKVVPSGTGCVVKWSIEYVPAVPEAPIEQTKETAVLTFKAIESYILSSA